MFIGVISGLLVFAIYYVVFGGPLFSFIRWLWQKNKRTKRIGARRR